MRARPPRLGPTCLKDLRLIPSESLVFRAVKDGYHPSPKWAPSWGLNRLVLDGKRYLGYTHLNHPVADREARIGS